MIRYPVAFFTLFFVAEMCYTGKHENMAVLIHAMVRIVGQNFRKKG